MTCQKNSAFRYSWIIVLLPICAFAQAESQNPAGNYFANAVQVLEASNLSQTFANRAILDANKIRKQIVALRAKARKTDEPLRRKDLKQEADQLTIDLKELQARGNQSREKSKILFKEALYLFEQGLVEKFGDRIHSRNPILMGDSTSLFFAHNTRIRSVHPNMLNKMGTPTDEIGQARLDREMSILVPALAAQNAPPELDISSFQISREQQYIAHIEVESEEIGRSGDDKSLLVPPNTIHKWLLMLSDLQGEPVRNADIKIVGHMPGHVHGLPTQPRVTQELSAGIYLVEGLKFQMKGWWTMQFNLEANNNASDSITFNLVL